MPAAKRAQAIVAARGGKSDIALAVGMFNAGRAQQDRPLFESASTRPLDRGSWFHDLMMEPQPPPAIVLGIDVSAPGGDFTSVVEAQWRDGKLFVLKARNCGKTEAHRLPIQSMERL